MRRIYMIFNIEAGRFINLKSFLFIFIFISISLFYTHNGIVNFKQIQHNVEKFKEIEQLKVIRYINYELYGEHGFEISFLTTTQAILFYKSGLFDEMYTHINTMIDLNMYEPLKGKNVFSKNSRNSFDFSNWLLLLGSFLALICGYNTFRNKEYLRFLNSFPGHLPIHIISTLARFIIMSFFFFITFLLVILLIRIEGINLFAADYMSILQFYGIWILVSFAFYLVGLIIWTFLSGKGGLIAIFSFWIAIHFFIPGILEDFSNKKAKNIETNIKADLEKWGFMRDFEERVIRSMGKPKTEDIQSPPAKKLIESFMTNEYHKMREIDRNLENKMREVTSYSQKLSLILPSTIYHSYAFEMSGRGYESVNDFFAYCRELKHKFCLFYKQKRFYDIDTKVKSFITNGENVYHASAKIPANMGAGILVLFLYATGLSTLAFYRVKSQVFSLGNKHTAILKVLDFNRDEIRLKQGRYYPFKLSNSQFIDFLYTLLSGKRTQKIVKFFNGENKIYINDKNISDESNHYDFFYLPNTDMLPGEIKAGDLFMLAAEAFKYPSEKRQTIYNRLNLDEYRKIEFEKLPVLKQLEILLSFTEMKECPIYLINLNFGSISISDFPYLQTVFHKLSNRNALTIIFTERLETLPTNNPDNVDILDISYYFKGNVNQSQNETETHS